QGPGKNGSIGKDGVKGCLPIFKPPPYCPENIVNHVESIEERYDQPYVHHCSQLYTPWIQKTEKKQKGQEQEYQHPIFCMKFQVGDVKGFVKVKGEITGHQEPCAIGQDVLQAYWN